MMKFQLVVWSGDGETLVKVREANQGHAEIMAIENANSEESWRLLDCT